MFHGSNRIVMATPIGTQLIQGFRPTHLPFCNPQTRWCHWDLAVDARPNFLRLGLSVLFSALVSNSPRSNRDKNSNNNSYTNRVFSDFTWSNRLCWWHHQWWYAYGLYSYISDNAASTNSNAVVSNFLNVRLYLVSLVAHVRNDRWMAAATAVCGGCAKFGVPSMMFPNLFMCFRTGFQTTPYRPPPRWADWASRSYGCWHPDRWQTMDRSPNHGVPYHSVAFYVYLFLGAVSNGEWVDGVWGYPKQPWWRFGDPYAMAGPPFIHGRHRTILFSHGFRMR